MLLQLKEISLDLKSLVDDSHVIFQIIFSQKIIAKYHHDAIV